MFSIFKQASGTQEAALKDLTEDQLSEVAGGKHHHHHHHMKKAPAPVMPAPPAMPTMPAMPAMPKPPTVTVEGVVYPTGSHW